MVPGWLPEIARRHPRRRLRFEYRALTDGRPLPPDWRERALLALSSAHIACRSADDHSLEMTLPWSTRVLGLVRRDLEERLTLVLSAGEESSGFLLDGLAQETHEAHATGLAGVILMAATVWLTTGWLTGAPAGLTTALAGGLWADACRELAMGALERRVRRLAEDLGSAIWPHAPAELIASPLTRRSPPSRSS